MRQAPARERGIERLERGTHAVELEPARERALAQLAQESLNLAHELGLSETQAIAGLDHLLRLNEDRRSTR